METESFLHNSRKLLLVERLSLFDECIVLLLAHGDKNHVQQERLDLLVLAEHADHIDSSYRLLREETVEDESRIESQELKHESSGVTSDALEANSGL